MNSNILKWSVALVSTLVTFLIGAPAGAYIGEMYLAIPDPIAGAFLAVFMATATAYILAPKKKLLFAFVVWVSALIVFAVAFQPFDPKILTYFLSGIFSGVLSLVTVASTNFKLGHNMHNKPL